MKKNELIIRISKVQVKTGTLFLRFSLSVGDREFYEQLNLPSLNFNEQDMRYLFKDIKNKIEKLLGYIEDQTYSCKYIFADKIIVMTKFISPEDKNRRNTYLFLPISEAEAILIFPYLL